jgi:hypothetical protein
VSTKTVSLVHADTSYVKGRNGVTYAYRRFGRAGNGPPVVFLQEVQYETSIPTVQDRVVQAALKLVLEPIFEAEFQPCSYGFRPRRRAQDAIAEIHLLASNPRNYEWVLEADIVGASDEPESPHLIELHVMTLHQQFVKHNRLSSTDGQPGAGRQRCGRQPIPTKGLPITVRSREENTLLSSAPAKVEDRSQLTALAPLDPRSLARIASQASEATLSTSFDFDVNPCTTCQTPTDSSVRRTYPRFKRGLTGKADPGRCMGFQLAKHIGEIFAERCRVFQAGCDSERRQCARVISGLA